MALILSGSERLTLLAIEMKEGERRATEALYNELSPKVYGFLFARTGEKEVSEDLMQRIFIKLIEKIASYDREKGRFTVWFWRIVHNALVDYYREKKETPFSILGEEVVESLAIAEAAKIEEKMQCDKIKSFLETLASADRTLFEMRYISEMSYKDIASALARSEGSLRVTALRVRGKIRKEFKGVMQ